MKQESIQSFRIHLRLGIVAFILAAISVFLFSFTAATIVGDLFTTLGIEKQSADKKITESILGGYVDAYGLKNAKNIAIGNRSAITKDLLEYIKKHTASEAFKKEYASLKLDNKPTEQVVQSPEDMRKETIAMYKKSIAEMEETIKKADANTKPIFEKVLVDAKKQLKEAEDPNNKQFAGYAKGYPDMVKSNKENYQRAIDTWEAEYPTNHMLFVKQRLQQFLAETRDIDFSAELTSKNGKNYFVNRAYESKSNRWKMAFRAGKEVVEPARAYVESWLNEIK
ncbi:hypothetical protein [Flavihumibacter fluvii]|uniref:hypothetical protein n=1 Tax=Flavihumibacter fluvii TaxID=2838157 RepID=UPI001BDE8C32|nr:hypothetical protein [Flavihumibacter fluvii]ULQ53172.1 hypothetical protein KJS93_02420 [Flavihumibacter fluvii]